MNKVHMGFEPLKARGEIPGAYLHFEAWSWNDVLQHNDEVEEDFLQKYI